MKNLTILIALLVALAVGTLPAAAQTSIATTTLSVASTNMSATSFPITVASATGISAGTILWIDGAVYRVLSVSGTTVTVINQYRPATHLTSATVFIVPLQAQVGLDPVGSCLRSTAGRPPAYSPYTIMFNLTNGNMWTCRGASGSRTWVGTNQYAIQVSANPPQTP